MFFTFLLLSLLLTLLLLLIWFAYKNPIFHLLSIQVLPSLAITIIMFQGSFFSAQQRCSNPSFEIKRGINLSCWLNLHIMNVSCTCYNKSLRLNLIITSLWRYATLFTWYGYIHITYLLMREQKKSFSLV